MIYDRPTLAVPIGSFVSLGALASCLGRPRCPASHNDDNAYRNAEGCQCWNARRAETKAMTAAKLGLTLLT